MRILVIFTGGTIGCGSKGGVLTPQKSNSYRLLEMYKEVDANIEFDAVQPYTILSENLCANHLNALYRCIAGVNLGQYAGVIVAHGTDTLPYTAAFLSYQFGLSCPPIVLVSANFPLDDARSNGFINFCSAVSFIKSGQGRGVFVSYTNTGDSRTAIHRGQELLPHAPYSDSLFSLDGNVYGYVENGGFVRNSSYKERTERMNGARLSGKVLYLKAYVGITYPRLDSSVKAVLMEGYHSGTLSTDEPALSEFCAQADMLSIPVFLTGACDGFNYDSKLRFHDLKIKVLPPMSPIAAYVKLWLM